MISVMTGRWSLWTQWVEVRIAVLYLSLLVWPNVTKADYLSLWIMNWSGCIPYAAFCPAAHCLQTSQERWAHERQHTVAGPIQFSYNCSGLTRHGLFFISLALDAMQSMKWLCSLSVKIRWMKVTELQCIVSSILWLRSGTDVEMVDNQSFKTSPWKSRWNNQALSLLLIMVRTLGDMSTVVIVIQHFIRQSAWLPWDTCAHNLLSWIAGWYLRIKVYLQL